MKLLKKTFAALAHLVALEPKSSVADTVLQSVANIPNNDPAAKLQKIADKILDFEHERQSLSDGDQKLFASRLVDLLKAKGFVSLPNAFTADVPESVAPAPQVAAYIAIGVAMRKIERDPKLDAESVGQLSKIARDGSLVPSRAPAPFASP